MGPVTLEDVIAVQLVASLVTVTLGAFIGYNAGVGRERRRHREQAHTFIAYADPRTNELRITPCSCGQDHVMVVNR